MTEEKLPTQFAPAERDSKPEIQKQSGKMLALSMLRQLLNAVPDICLILNGKRQIVFANQQSLDFLQAPDAKSVYGSRPGEALNCIHSSETAGGCGTTETCQHCGAVLAILSSQKGQVDKRECRIARNEGEALNLRVSATPFELESRRYTIFSAADINHEKRREVLERTLFQSILQRAKEIRESVEKLREPSVEELHLFREDSSRFFDTLVEEINMHRLLKAAEKDELNIHPRSVHTLDLLRQVIQPFLAPSKEQGRSIEIYGHAKNTEFITDPILLKIVLGHMVRNALEACEEGETIMLNVVAESQEVEFLVHNPNYIPKDVQLQIFQRGFTTKGNGRGLGTYIMRLLSEKYLEGKVSFVSKPKMGTTFKARYLLS